MPKAPKKATSKRAKKPRRWQDLKLVEIVWEDASLDTSKEATLGDAVAGKEFSEPCICRDIGYLIKADRKAVVLAISITTEDDGYRHANTIPRSMVKSIIYLTRPREAQDEAIKKTAKE